MVAVLTVAIVLAAAGATLAAQPTHSAVYTGQIFSGSLGKVEFQVSANGRTMKFKGATAFTVSCRNKRGQFTGGGEAEIVESGGQSGALPAPLVKIQPNGTFYGARTFDFPGAPAPTKYHFEGKFTGSGATAVGKLIESGCSTAPFSLKRR
jgi:hypothetical protein